MDTYAFALGSGIAGLAGCALIQIGNVGPDLGQSYIVDSFMVVVLGGVGQLAGTVYAALGLGILNKFLEGWAGAVLAKIAVLVLHHHLHPEAAAGAVRDEGPERGGMSAVAARTGRCRTRCARLGVRVLPMPALPAARAMLLGSRAGWPSSIALVVVCGIAPLLNLRGAGGQRLPHERLRRRAGRQDHVLRDRARWRWT